MSEQINYFYYFITGGALLLSVAGLWFTALIPEIDRFGKRFFLCFFVTLLLASVSVLVEMILHDYPISDHAILFLLILETLLLSLPMPMQTFFLLHCLGEVLRTSRLLRTVLGLWTVFFVILAGIPFIDGFIYVTPENEYSRGFLYPLILTPMITILLLNFIHTIRYRARLSHKVFLSFVIAQVPMAFTLIVNLFVDIVPLFDISYVLSALTMYGIILSDQIEKERHLQQEIIRQQREIAHERFSVMVLQMRPHFIYNTLMSIHSLCRLNPQKAGQLTMDFTNYLRKNFNAVASDRTIPFSTELEHTRAYLAVEQAQYDDMLVVDYDTPFIQFRLPPLTLQPIVENAVKHGINPYAGALHIFIRTRHKDHGTEITVEDTGPGFDPSDESKPHIALKNIRERLEMMSGGNMIIMPRDGGGTIVKLTIP